MNKNWIKTKFGHWTFRYIYNRFFLAFRELLYPNNPWLPKEATFILEKLLKPTDVGLEFGSGRSTLWFSKKIGRLVSIESDKFWFSKITNEIKKQNIKNIEYYFKSEVDYTSILDKMNDNSLDFVLVDGLLRDICAKKSITKLKNGGILIIDNINWFAPSDSHSPASKCCNNFYSEVWREIFEKDIKDWRKIWVSNGVTDTIISFKSS